jgi:hypothetical protein
MPLLHLRAFSSIRVMWLNPNRYRHLGYQTGALGEWGYQTSFADTPTAIQRDGRWQCQDLRSSTRNARLARTGSATEPSVPFIREARAGKASSQKLFDGHRLYLTLTKAGTPVWRLKYALGGRERVFAIGVYPAVSLAQARQAREEARALTREGKDPTKTRLVRRAQAVTSTATTFADVAKEWLATRQPGWSQVHYRISKRALERDVFPTLGRLPVRDITPSMIAAVIERVMDRDVRETAGKILQHVNAVCRFAQARGIREDNPAAPVNEILPRRRRVSRRPAILEIQPLRDLLAKADVAESPLRCALHTGYAHSPRRGSGTLSRPTGPSFRSTPNRRNGEFRAGR